MKILLYDHWKFHLAENAKPDFTKLDTYEWRAVQLPHDWSTDYPFDENANTSGSGGYARAGIGWYWRSFEVKKEDNERVLLYFEGIYMNSSVYVNGSLAGGHVYGYTPFELDVTELVKEGSNEVLIVVDNSLQPGSRWYSGSGITRDVWMETRNTLHIARYGTYCVTELEQEKASLQVSVTIHDENISCKDSVKLIVTLYAPDGTKVAESEAFATKEWKAGDLEALVMNGKDSKEVPRLWTNTINTELLVENPVLWTVDNPALYQLTVSLYEGETCLETRTQVVGIRSAAFDNKKGFLLNGEQVKLNGVCLHHDGGCVGAAVPKAIWERRLKKLKNMGVNSIRCSHNPPDVALLDLCDEMGFLVMDEAFDEWEHMKAKAAGANTHESHGYSVYFKECYEWDIKTMLYRDRNHPSIVLWSIGNEVPDQNIPGGEIVARNLKEICHFVDPSRYITQANDQIVAEPVGARQEFLEELDVVGYNYVGRWRKRAESFYDEDHESYPHRCVIGSENPSAGYVRSEYIFEHDKKDFWYRPYYSAPVAVGKLLRYTMTHDFVAGDYMWTGIDYLGESHWPRRSASCGCLDTCGFEKDAFYFYKSVWNKEEHFAYLCPHWNLSIEEGTVISVICYTTCEDAELFVNGKSYGMKSKGFPCYGMTETYGHFDRIRRPANTDDLFLSWDVPYVPGKLEVVGYHNENEVCRYTLETTGRPARIALAADKSVIKADDRDVAQVEVRIVDSEGRLVPTADCEVEITLEGDAKILGIDNGRPDCHELWKDTKRSTFHGMLLIVVQAGKTAGSVKLSVKGKNLEAAALELIIDK
ncbi:MAG: DUF4982 domain-containing protein [Lachnospiraceae bacterium]|nr:DUF4982 domain-containing protein [Lachnospiraceae bacterium]